MRLRSDSFVVLIVVSLALVAFGSGALARAEAAKSTIRIVSATEPATPVEAPAPQQSEPVNLEQPPEQPESVQQPRLLQQPESAQRLESNRPKVAPAAPIVRPTQRASQYPVQRANYATPTNAPSLVHAPMGGRAPSMVGVYSSANAQATLSKMPRPAPVQPRTTAAAPMSHLRGKPFQSVQSEPALSPYLNMYRSDANANNLPNYFAYVRPQLEQQEASRQQTAEIQKLRGQLQNISSGGGGAPTSANMTAHAHYMDTAQFYRNTRH